MSQQVAADYFEWHARPDNYGDVTRHIRPGDRVLDVGCGTAWLSTSCERYTGLDSAEAAVSAAVDRGVDARVADLSRPLDLESESFDLVVAKDILEHLDHPGALVGELRRVLKPGGRVYAASPDSQSWVWDDYTHVRPFTQTGFRRLFEDQGFQVEQVQYMALFRYSWSVPKRRSSHTQPLWLRQLARIPGLRRNVELIASRP